jgi:hypothetical protein
VVVTAAPDEPEPLYRIVIVDEQPPLVFTIAIEDEEDDHDS